MRRLGLVRPRDLVPSPPLGGALPAGRQWVFVGPAGVSSQVPWSLAIAGHRRPGQSVAPQSSCPVSSWRHGSHLPYTSAGHATSQSVKCQAGTQSACPMQRRLRYVRCWLFSSIGSRRAATTPQVQCGDRGLGRWPRGHAKKGAVPDATGIIKSPRKKEMFILQFAVNPTSWTVRKQRQGYVAVITPAHTLGKRIDLHRWRQTWADWSWHRSKSMKPISPPQERPNVQ